MNALYRRGACPGLSTPMITGDGLLARLTPAGTTIALDAFEGLCRAARAHGNGIVEITSRGSIQFRGLNAVSAPQFAAAVASLRIDASDGIPVLVNPLSGLDLGKTCDVGVLAAALRRSLASGTQNLSAKVSVVMDGGGALHLDAMAADIRVLAVEGTMFHVALGGDAAAAMPIGAVAPDNIVACVQRLLDTLAATASKARMRDAIQCEGLGVFKSAVADLVSDAPAPVVRPDAEAIGLHPLRGDETAVGLGLPFGHADAETLLRLIAIGRRAGACGLRTAPGRALLMLELQPAAARAFAADAGALGFIVDAYDPRRRVVACAGAPICSSGEIPARAMAPTVVSAAGAMSPKGIVHVSGCYKGCAHPTPAPVAVFGRDRQCDVLLDGVLANSVAVEDLPDQLKTLMAARASKGAQP